MSYSFASRGDPPAMAISSRFRRLSSALRAGLPYDWNDSPVAVSMLVSPNIVSRSRRKNRRPPERLAPPPTLGWMRRAVYIGLAMLFLGLGLLGAVLPVLPATPFFLLTSYFLARSSARLHAKVMRLPVVGRFLRDWSEQRGVRPRVKAIAYVSVLALLGASLAFSMIPWYVKVATASLSAVGLYVVWRIPTIR